MSDADSETFDVQGFARDIHELLVLSALRDGPRHGYQLALDIEEGSNGLFRLKHGTLYPILHRLEGEGWIRGSWAREGRRRKKVYELTPAGRRQLAGGTGRIQRIVSRLLGFLRDPDAGTAPA